MPLFGFVFLVALGVDYNIFLMSRVREESLKHGTRPGILRGLGVTGGVITSAGVVLAATFAALGVIPIMFLVQLAFIVAFGVLLDTVLVRSLLVPALAYDLGAKIWWPGKLARAGASAAGQAAGARRRTPRGGLQPLTAGALPVIYLPGPAAATAPWWRQQPYPGWQRGLIGVSKSPFRTCWRAAWLDKLPLRPLGRGTRRRDDA